jgi:beta-glucanase (GH16 family)
MGQGLWPAFWMLGANINTVSWPACGETDIMEHINTENKIYATIHWDNNGHASYGGNTTTTPADYHIYAVEWDAAAIRWYIDGVQYHEANILNSINGTEEFHKPFFYC